MKKQEIKSEKIIKKLSLAEIDVIVVKNGFFVKHLEIAIEKW